MNGASLPITAADWSLCFDFGLVTECALCCFCLYVFRGVNLQLSIFHFNNQVLRKINIAVESEGQKLGVYKS